MSKHEFSRRSGIPRSTLRSIELKADYDIGEINILKISRGMGVQPFELFLDADCPVVTARKDEMNLLLEYRKLQEADRLRLEGYLRALMDQGM